MKVKSLFCHLKLQVATSVQEFMNFSAATIAERTPAGQRQSVESESKRNRLVWRGGMLTLYIYAR